MMLFDGKNPIKQVFCGSRPLLRIYKGTLLIWTNNRKYARILLSAITRVYGAAQKHTISAKASLSSAFAIASTATKRVIIQIVTVVKATTSAIITAQVKKVKSLAGILLSTSGLSCIGRTSKRLASAQATYQTSAAFGGGSTSNMPALSAIHTFAGFLANGASYYIHDVALWPIVITESITVTALAQPITPISAVVATTIAAALFAATKAAVMLDASLSSAFAIAATAKKSQLNGKSLLKIIASIIAKGRSGGKQIEHRATILSVVSATAANLTGNGSLLLANTLSASAAATEATSALGVTTNCAMALSITAKVSAWEYPVYNAESKDLSITQVYSAGQVGSILSIN